MISRAYDKRRSQEPPKKHSCALVSLLFLIGLVACETSQSPLHFPSLPVRDVLETGEKRAFKTMKHDSFRKAYLRYPSGKGNQHRIPIGGYLASRIVNLFPQDIEVDALELIEFQADCEEKEGFLFSSEEVICNMSGQFRLLLYKASHRVDFSVQQADIGKRIHVNQPGFFIGASPHSDRITQQLSDLMDRLAEDIIPKLNDLFVRVERSTLF